MTVVKRNRGALLAQRSLPRRRLDHVWASGHNHTWQAPRFLWERKLAQRRLRGRVPNWHRVPCEGPEAQQIWDALSLSDGILNASTTRRDGSSNDRHRPSKRGQRDGRQAERGVLLAQRSLPRRRLAHVGACGHEPNVAGTLRFLWKRKLAQRRPRDTDPASTRYPAGVPGRSKLGRSLSIGWHPQCFGHAP